MFSAFKEASGQWGTVTEIRGVSLWRLFLTLYGQQRGGSMFSEDGTELTLDDDKALRSLEFMQRARLGPQADADGPRLSRLGRELLRTRLTGTMLQGEWEVTTFQAAKLPFDMTPVPNILGEPRQPGRRRMPSSSRSRPGAPTSASTRRSTFVAGMLESSYTWAQGGHVPAWQPGARERRVPEARAAVALRGGRGADGRRPARVVLRLRLGPRERGLGLPSSA